MDWLNEYTTNEKIKIFIRDFDEYLNELAEGEIKVRNSFVEYMPNLGKLHIYSDHPPPHFHIVYKDKGADYKFRIDNLELISGPYIKSKQIKSLKYWYFQQGGKDILMNIWNDMNP